MAPFAPHITESLYAQINADDTQNNADKIQRHSVSSQRKSAGSIHLSQWPKWDENLIKDDEVKIAVQINGKVRAEIIVSNDIKEEEIKAIALKEKNIISWIENKEIKRVIYVPGKILNIVI